MFIMADVDWRHYFGMKRVVASYAKALLSLH